MEKKERFSGKRMKDTAKIPFEAKRTTRKN